MFNAYTIVREFENVVASYTGAPYAVSVDSCTSALFLCCKYLSVGEVQIPSETYLSVPMSIIHAGGSVVFDKRRNGWKGLYRLKPYNIYDAAKRFHAGMYLDESFMCLSFHIKKHLKLGKGGMILLDNADAADWFRKARYEGRSEKPYKEDSIETLGWNMYMTPEQAAHGLALMQNMPHHNDDLSESYRDLTEFPVFKHCKIIGLYDTGISSSTGVE